MTTYVVLNEHTLGYFQSDSIPTEPTMMQVLHGIIWKGGYDWKNGPVHYLPSLDRIRLATKEDFDTYRVVPPKGLFE